MAERDVTVRPARPDERVAVRRVLDAAVLAVDDELLARALDDEGALVAVSEGRVVGALVADTAGARDGTERDGEAGEEEASDDATNDDGEESRERSGAHVDAIAVTRRRRARGVGTALVTAAAERWRPLSADFDADVRPFYEKLGFEIGALDGDEERHRGRLH
ncbi:GNAT superfamily N-acetyltransferase [Halarchaeum rubridurum]|uniref:GNAT superfamily N-acetyltransferase n=1 Tax=Halarchaeum rubridurum TaxID=489911 RepID=A0A830FTK6_9EURY|nr:GNAT family N-acetyltransferase [Halarchaeum rubridurum]MBP1954341.1 GNAT superfamily N-acetyltransferase [Halarchaeum rubridurum]GGM59289.1 hypothetical protein GCM10009017_06760 [Halarchaeum rubridurum]